MPIGSALHFPPGTNLATISPVPKIHTVKEMGTGEAYLILTCILYGAVLGYLLKNTVHYVYSRMV